LENRPLLTALHKLHMETCGEGKNLKQYLEEFRKAVISVDNAYADNKSHDAFFFLSKILKYMEKEIKEYKIEYEGIDYTLPIKQVVMSLYHKVHI